MRKGVRLCITGSEVMNGFVLDKNTQFFASELYARGYELRESRILHDDPEQIIKTWNEFRATGDIIINSGGLGPTSDDLTVDLLCQWLSDTPAYDPHAEKRTRYFFERRAKDKTRTLSIDVALRQARIPSRAQSIRNTVGLAPGIFIPEAHFIALPGFPDEIRGMWSETLKIIEDVGVDRAETRIIPVWGVGESQLFSELPKHESIVVGVHALPWGCRLFLRQADVSASTASQDILDVLAYLESRYPGQIVENPLGKLIDTLKSRNLTMALAESCTGGLAAKQVTDIPGVSSVFQGGVVSYANSVKTAQLGVESDILQNFGAVSSECAAAMARGAAEGLGADLGISFTGVAGPDGGSKDKPVGTVFIGLHDRKAAETRVAKFYFPFGRERFRNATVACGWLAAWQLYEKRNQNFPLSEFLAV
jgi:nicotinamide-nucleotide amidase